MGIRSTVIALAALLALTGCTDDDTGATPTPRPTTDADCDAMLPESVLTGLGWTPRGAAEATVRGCHREAEQGYVEVRERPTASYDQLCRTLDRTGGVAPGASVDWLGDGVTACAVEPTGGVGQTKVVVRRDDGVTQVSVAALVVTDQALVRQAVQSLVG